jgi:hypothetical protein
MPTRKTAFILDDGPDVLVCQLVRESDHRGPRRPILDHPEELTLRAVTPKAMMVKIPRGRIQRSGKWTITGAALTMAICAASLAFI